MTPKTFFEIACRIIGVLFMVVNITVLLPFASAWLLGIFGIEGFDNENFPLFAPQLLGFVFAGMFGVVLFAYAPTIAERFYPEQDEDEISNDNESAGMTNRFGPGDVYQTALVVFGIYLLVQAGKTLISLVVTAFDYGHTALFDGRNIGSFAETILYATVACVLIFGAQKIASMLTGQTYDSNSIPKPKFSLALIVILLMLFGVLFGVIFLLMVSRDFN